MSKITPPVEKPRKGKPFPAKPHAIALRNWVKNQAPSPAALQLPSDRRGRIYLFNLPGVGNFELYALKKNTPYLFSFENKKNGEHIDKTVHIREVGKKDAVSLYLKKEGKYYRFGLSVEVTMRMVGAQALKWFEQHGPSPSKIKATSDKQGRIYITAKNRKGCYIKAQIQPEHDYNLEFFEETEVVRNKEYTNLCVNVREINGALVNTYYFRFRGRFYHTARPKESAIRDAAPKRLTSMQKTHRRSRAIREYLEGRTENPGSFPIIINKDGAVTLTTLSHGQAIILRGLGKGKRSGRLTLSEDSNGNITATVYEKSGILNNRYRVKENEQIITLPSGELGFKNKFKPEVREILEWLGLDQNGNLIKRPDSSADLIHELDKAPTFYDSYQAAWWLHRIRLLAKKELSLAALIFELWQRGKIPRNKLKDFAFAGHCIDIYLGLTPTNLEPQKFGSYLDLFQAISRLSQRTNLVTLTAALFIGGAISPRKKASFLFQLAQAYAYAQRHPWVQQSPNFEDNFGEALRFLAINNQQDAPYRLLILSLMVLNSFSSKNIRMKVIALNHFLRLLPQLGQEIERLGTRSLPNEEKITAARAQFDRSLLTDKKGSPLGEETQDIVLDLVFKGFAEDLLLHNDRQALEALLQQPSPRQPQRSEEALYALAQTAPVFEDPVEATLWLQQHRIADYSLGYHMNYLYYCRKIPPQNSIAFHMLAGAYDHLLSNSADVIYAIKKAAMELSGKPYQTPFTIAKRILRTRTLQKSNRQNPLSLKFTYFLVVLALEHYKTELKHQIERISPTRKAVNKTTRETIRCLEMLRHPRINMDYYSIEDGCGIPNMLLWRILNRKEKSTPFILRKLHTLLAEQLRKRNLSESWL